MNVTLLALLLLPAVCVSPTVKIPSPADLKTAKLEGCSADSPIVVAAAKYGENCCEKPKFKESCDSGKAFEGALADAKANCDGKTSCDYTVCRCTKQEPTLQCGAQHCIADTFAGCNKDYVIEFSCGEPLLQAGWARSTIILLLLLGVTLSGWSAVQHMLTGKWPLPARLRELRGLVADGVAFSFGGGARARTSCAHVVAAEPLLQGGAAAGSSSAGSKQKKEKKRGSKSSKGSKEQRAKVAKSASPAPPPPAPPAAPAREWAPTRSGLLAAGARETGVKVTL